MVDRLAGLDKSFDSLAGWGSYVSPVAMMLLPFSIDTFMGVVGLVESTVGTAILTCWTRIGSRPGHGARRVHAGPACRGPSGGAGPSVQQHPGPAVQRLNLESGTRPALERGATRIGSVERLVGWPSAVRRVAS